MPEEKQIAHYDRVRGGLEGVAVFSPTTTVRSTQIITGKTETYIVETARHSELGDTVFVECTNDDGVVRLAMPPKVANAIARQREALTKRIRRSEGKRIAKERAAAGIVPFGGKPFRRKKAS